MNTRVYPTAAELVEKVTAAAEEETLILTSGGRLARRLRHAFRQKQRETGRRGWLPPKILNLNAWLLETFSRTWPEEITASTVRLWRLWEKTLAQADLPEGLSPDLSLFQGLDDTYRVMIRDKVSSSPFHPISPVVAWREGLFREFEKALSREGLLHPALLPKKVMESKVLRTLKLPKKVFLLGFDFPAPLEADLLRLLSERFGAVLASTHPLQEPKVRAVSLPNREEEVIWLIEEALRSAQTFPLHRIGVIVPNPTPYLPLISSAFREIVGPSVREEEGLYNISLGSPLWEQPLVQAAVLPLRFFLEGEPRNLLLSLFLSPYYGRWQGRSYSLACADRVWRSKGVDLGLASLLQTLERERCQVLSSLFPEGESWIPILESLRSSPKNVSQWVKALRDCWDCLGFPVSRLPGEEGFFQHLQAILDQMGKDLKDEVMNGPTFFAWLKALSARTLVNEPGYEEAGIQVLGLIEARGLDFDRLFLIGMTEGCLPQPVRVFPLLSPEERRMVQGATLESQFAFARTSFNHLRTLSPHLTLTRPEEENGEPLPPSPFWPDHEVIKERNIWIDPGEVWIRAAWLSQTRKGIRRPVPYPPQETHRLSSADPNPIPPALSASALETFLACPFHFFCERVLKISPLEEIESGIPAREKGEFVHKVLAEVTRALRLQAVPLEDMEAVDQVVRTCMDRLLEEKGEDLYWRVEKKRLLGESERLGGLMGRWMEAEKERWEKGWRWIVEEVPFHDLVFPKWSFTVQGRIDRIDWNRQTGEVCCWDYKTGRLPDFGDVCNNLLAPQLPLYLLAVRSLIDSLPSSPTALKAGFVRLKSEGELAFKEPGRAVADWDDCLAKWVEEIARVGKRMEEGLFPPEPRPEPQRKDQGACAYCDYTNLCAYWKRSSGGSPFWNAD